MGNPGGNALHGLGQSFQGLMREVIALETAKKGFDQAVGLGAATRGAASDESQMLQELLQGTGDELRAIVGKELQAFGRGGLMTEA